MGRDRRTIEAETEAVVRRALASGFGDNVDAVERSLVEAVAHGRGDRNVVREETRKVFGEEPPLELVLFDTDQIGRWVYESSRPPVIAGASRILEELNQEIEEDERFRDLIVFSGGGEGLLLTPHGEGEGIERRIEELYTKKSSGALTVTTARLPVSPVDFVPAPMPQKAAPELLTGTPAVLTRLRDRARRAKDQSLPPTQPVAGHRQRCASCRDRAGVHDIKRFRTEERGALCEPCVTRWDVGKKLIAGKSFEDVIEVFQDQLGGPSPRDRYLGFLYADGDAMGLLFRQVRSLSDFRFLSRAVAEVFRAVRDEARERTRELVTVADEELPFLSLLGGGDEMMLLVPGGVAVDLATRTPRWLDEATSRTTGLGDFLDRAGRKSLTVGMGLVIADLHYPVRYQYRLAKDLQTSAKRRFYGADPAEAASTLDFIVLTDASPSAEDLETARAVTYGTAEPGFVKTCRPYRVERLREILASIARARHHGVATTQLYQLRDGADEGEAVFLNFLRYQIGRKSPGENLRPWLLELGIDPAEPEALARFFLEPQDGGKTRGLWLPDALELAPFLELLETLEPEVDDAAA